jgi:ketosteroid isomerase-like protein
MSKADNVALVKKAYKAFGKGDIKAVLKTTAEDIEWETPQVEGMPFGGALRGKAAVEDFFRLLVEHEEVLEFSPEEFIAEGKQVAVLGRFRGRVRATGKLVDTPWVQVFTIRGGKITRFFELFDTANAELAYKKSG